MTAYFFFFRCLILFALSRATLESASSFGTCTSLRASASNAPNPRGFGLSAMTESPLGEAHESGIVFAGQNSIREALAHDHLQVEPESHASSNIAPSSGCLRSAIAVLLVVVVTQLPNNGKCCR